MRVIRTQAGHGLFKLHQAADGVEVENAFAVHLVHDLPLDEDGEPLVEPEVLPGFVGHEVTAPRVRNLVRHHMRLASIPRKQRGGNEREARVLHASVRERRRQEEQVVPAPDVWSRHLLCRLEEILSLAEFKSTRLDHLGLAPNLRTRSNLHSLHVAHRQRQEVRRDGHVLFKLERTLAVASIRGFADRNGGHERGQGVRGGHLGAVSHLGAGGILAREQRPRVNRLALREQVRVFSPGGLLGPEPLNSGRGRRRAIRNDNVERRVLLHLLVELDNERRAHHRVGFANRERQIGTVELHTLDVQIARVQHEG